MANQVIHGNTTFHVGDTIRVHYRIIEKEKVAGKAKREVKEEIRERIQIFEGIVISIDGRGNGTSFQVRRIGVNAVGIERIFPLISPWIKLIEVIHEGKVRRAKLYYIREKVGKEASFIKEKKTPPKAGKKAKKTSSSPASKTKKETRKRSENKQPNHKNEPGQEKAGKTG